MEAVLKAHVPAPLLVRLPMVPVNAVVLMLPVPVPVRVKSWVPPELTPPVSVKSGYGNTWPSTYDAFGQTFFFSVTARMD